MTRGKGISVKPEALDSASVLVRPLAASHEVRQGGGLVRNLAYMITSTAVIRSGGILFAVLLRRILAPQLIGIWNLIEIIVAYLCTATLGVSYSSERLIPYYRARGNREAEINIRNSLFSWNIAEGLLLSLGVIVYVILFGDQYTEGVHTGLCWLPLLFLAQKLLSVYLMLLKSTKEFRVYSVANVVATMLDWSLVVWAFLWNLEGVFTGAAVIGLVKLAYLHIAVRHLRLFSFRWRLNLSGLRLHLPYGPTYTAFKAIWTFVERLDSLFVGYLLGTGVLAYYYLGFQLSKLALEVPIALAYIAFPNMMERVSVSREGQTLSSEFFRYLRFDLFVILPVVLPLGYFGSEFLIRQFLPAFSQGIVVAKISMMAVGMLAIRYLYYQVLMAYEQIGRLIFVTTVQLPAFLGSFFLLRGFISEPLTAVAVAMFLAYAVHLGFVLWATRSTIQRDCEGWLCFWGSDLLGCFTWAGLLIIVDWAMLGAMGGTLIHDLGQVAARVAFFGLLAVPVAYLGLGPDRQGLSRRLFKHLRWVG